MELIYRRNTLVVHLYSLILILAVVSSALACGCSSLADKKTESQQSRPFISQAKTELPTIPTDNQNLKSTPAGTQKTYDPVNPVQYVSGTSPQQYQQPGPPPNVNNFPPRNQQSTQYYQQSRSLHVPSGGTFQKQPNLQYNVQRQLFPAQRFQGQNQFLASPAVRTHTAAEVVATVEDRPILVGDLLTNIDQLLGEHEGKVPDEKIEEQRKQLVKLLLRQAIKDTPPEKLEDQRNQLIQQLLPSAIRTKVLYVEFLRQVPPERLPEIEQTLFDKFNESQLEPLMKSKQATSEAQLEQILRQYGSSLHKKRRVFMEQVLANEMLKRGNEVPLDISYNELRDYYFKHLEEYQIKAKVRWEHIMVRFDRMPSKEAAFIALGEMGNRVVRGASFAEVAKRESHGLDAALGGYHDWTTKGSLKNEVIDKAIFSIPVGRLSKRIESEEGVHIVRVIERQEEGRESFFDAQVEIKEKILAEKRAEARRQYVDNLREKTHIWTIFDQANPSTQTANGSVPNSLVPRR